MDSNKISLIGCKNHIHQLGNQFRKAGFDGYFHTNGGFADKIDESLTRWITSYLEGLEYKQDFPVSLSTYSDWRGEDRDRTLCHFQVDYKKNAGFEVQSIEIKRLSTRSENIRTERIELKRGEEIPSLPKVNSLVSGKSINCRLRSKKRVRF